MESRNIPADFDEWMNVLANDRDIKVEDFAAMMYSMTIYLRIVLDFDEVQKLYRFVLFTAEEALQTGDALISEETGETINVLMAEERDELGVDTLEVPDTVPSEWE